GAHVAALAKLASKELQDPLEDSHFHLSMLMACLYSDNVEIRESAGDAIKALWTKDHAALLAWEAGEIAWHMHGSGRKLDDCLVNLIARGKNAIPPGNWSEDDKQDFKT